jgi:sigma-B regulation protein RsbU (phosphoserine phosphatase)
MSEQTRYLKNEVTRLKEENKALKEEVLSLRQYIDSLNALTEAVDEIEKGTEIMPVLDRILYNALMVINAEAGSLMVVDDDTQELVFVIAHGKVPREQLMGLRIPQGKGIAGWVAVHRKPAIVNNTSGDNRFYSDVDTGSGFHTDSILAVPIIGNGQVMGVVEVLNKRGGALFNQTDQMLMTLLCHFAGEVLSGLMLRQDVAAREAKRAAAAASPQAPTA